MSKNAKKNWTLVSPMFIKEIGQMSRNLPFFTLYTPPTEKIFRRNFWKCGLAHKLSNVHQKWANVLYIYYLYLIKYIYKGIPIMKIRDIGEFQKSRIISALGQSRNLSQNYFH
jgi:hypothetical protein